MLRWIIINQSTTKKKRTCRKCFRGDNKLRLWIGTNVFWLLGAYPLTFNTLLWSCARTTRQPASMINYHIPMIPSNFAFNPPVGGCLLNVAESLFIEIGSSGHHCQFLVLIFPHNKNTVPPGKAVNHAKLIHFHHYRLVAAQRQNQ